MATGRVCIISQLTVQHTQLLNTACDALHQQQMQQKLQRVLQVLVHEHDKNGQPSATFAFAVRLDTDVTCNQWLGSVACGPVK